MLILARFQGERIRIGDNIIVTVLETKRRGGRRMVRLGIDAPESVPVHREEVYDRIKKNLPGVQPSFSDTHNQK